MPMPLIEQAAEPTRAAQARKPARLIRAFAFLWMACSILFGSLLMSYHQPFRAPLGSGILALAPLSPTADPHNPQWRAIHILSGSCACSQRVMAHLAERGPVPGITEQILLIDITDGPDLYLPGSRSLLARLQRSGFTVHHLRSSDIPPTTGLRGVPLLLFANPEGHVAYLGGYGPRGDQDTILLADLRSGSSAAPLPVLGCAIGAHLRRTLDPLHLKY